MSAEVPDRVEYLDVSPAESPFRLEHMTQDEIRTLGGALYRASRSLRPTGSNAHTHGAEAEQAARLTVRRHSLYRVTELFHQAFRRYLAEDPERGFALLIATVYGDDKYEANFLLDCAAALVTRPGPDGQRVGGLSQGHVDRLLEVLVDLDLGRRSGPSDPDAALMLHTQLAEEGFLTAEQAQWLRSQEHQGP